MTIALMGTASAAWKLQQAGFLTISSSDDSLM
jgi:hypothetical protein